MLRNPEKTGNLHVLPIRRPPRMLNGVGRGAWSVGGKWSWGDAPGDRATVPFHCSTALLLSQAGKALEIGPAIGYRLWFPSRESMNAVGASCAQTIRKP